MADAAQDEVGGISGEEDDGDLEEEEGERKLEGMVAEKDAL